MKPSKLDWLIALTLFLFLFTSWDFGDTTAIVGHEVDFADAIVHGEFSNPYQRAYDRALYQREHKVYIGRAMPYYDLPVNLVLGVWGLPLYLIGGTEYVGDFWKILYGKSFFLLTFMLSAFLVYKICLALNLDKNKSQWGAFIYFTSSMAWNSVCLVGNLDAICTCLTLAGVLAYIRERNRECLIWFMLAFPFKQLAAFIYLPLLLLRDKNIFRDALKLAAIGLFIAICSIPVMNCPGAAVEKAKFLLGMIRRLINNTIPLMGGEVSVFIILYGLFCYFCWSLPESQDVRERNTATLFTAMTSIALTLSCILSHPQWFLYLAPYLAIAVVYYCGVTERVMFFETLGSLALLGYNFACFFWVYEPKCAKGMLLDILLGRRESVVHDTIKAYVESKVGVLSSGKSLLKILRHGLISVGGGVYIFCMILLLVFLCRHKNITTERDINLRPYVLARLFVNAAACYIPLAMFIRTIL